MKNLFGFNKSKENNVAGFELLSENEMLIVRGGTEPTRPISNPKDIYDFEEE